MFNCGRVQSSGTSPACAVLHIHRTRRRLHGDQSRVCRCRVLCGCERGALQRSLIEIESLVWKEWGVGRITETEAQFLSETIGRMKSIGQTARAVGAIASRLGSRFVSRQRPRSPDREASRARRRQLGGSGALPDPLRQNYTEGQRAVLCVIAGEVKKSGRCGLPIDRIGALAGVGRTTVQTTLHEARRLGHIRIQERPQRGRKSLTNVIEILSKEWLAWITRGPRRQVVDRVQSVHSNQKSEPHEERRVIEEGRWAGTRGASEGWMRPVLSPIQTASPFEVRGRRSRVG